MKKDLFTVEYDEDEAVEYLHLYRDFRASDPEGEDTFAWRMRTRKKTKTSPASTAPTPSRRSEVEAAAAADRLEHIKVCWGIYLFF